MNTGSTELSSRYYPAEITAWVLGAILILYKLIGLKEDQTIPFLNVNLGDGKYFPHIISFILIVVLLYLLLEFKQSDKKSKDNFLTYLRLNITVLWTMVALWVIFPDLVKNTKYETVSPIWFLSFFAIGYLLGMFFQILALSTLMIRSKDEAKRLSLPRLPNATQAMYFFGFPIFILLEVIYFTMHSYAPSQIVHFASILTAVAFLYMVMDGLLLLFRSRDSNEDIIPYKKKIGQFKEIHSSHDRSYDLIDFTKKIETPFSEIDSVKLRQNPQAIVREFMEGKIKEIPDNLPSAAMSGNASAVVKLIDQGQDVNIRAVGGWTALLSSSAQGLPEIMKILLDAGANPDIANVLGITPLIYGARYGNVKIVKMLINYGADLNLRDSHGDTALMKATEFGNKNIVALLIKKNVDITVKNFSKKNALDLAYEHGHGKIARLLRNASQL